LAGERTYAGAIVVTGALTQPPPQRRLCGEQRASGQDQERHNALEGLLRGDQE
jgi:hypothetical protein